MRTYETTFILGPQADEATFDRQVKAVSDLISNHRGIIHKEERIGIRRLAYPIKKYTQGYYTRFIYDADNSVLTELERFFKLEEPYIRYLTVVCEGNPDGMAEDFHRSSRRPQAVPNREVKEKPAVEETPAVEEQSRPTESPEVNAESVTEPRSDPEEATEEKQTESEADSTETKEL